MGGVIHRDAHLHIVEHIGGIVIIADGLRRQGQGIAVVDDPQVAASVIVQVVANDEGHIRAMVNGDAPIQHREFHRIRPLLLFRVNVNRIAKEAPQLLQAAFLLAVR